MLFAGYELCGSHFAFGFWMLREILDRSFRTTRQVQAALQIDCIALLPLVKVEEAIPVSSSAQKQIGDLSDRQFAQKGASSLVTEAPFSRFAEGIRALKEGMKDNHAAPAEQSKTTETKETKV